ncbi:ATP-grasp domain-containing protein [Tepidibacillus marianensis]|uniref:ATP-grasp domain-containing protein n=1 Tax=Tepidibacillus marianensis TaxID=3131995 RepID=UPI0030CF25E2
MMNIVCFKFNEDILANCLEKCDKVIFIQDQWDIENMNYSQSLMDRVFLRYDVNSIDSIEELAAVYSDIQSRNINIEKAISGAEYGIFAAGYFNALIKRNTLDLMVSISSRDKRMMKRHFNNVGVNYAKYVPSYDIYQLQSGIHHGLEYPIVVKPVCGTGTFNTEIVYSEKELIEYFEKLNMHPAVLSKLITLEEYINGEEYHVDIVWRDGLCKFISISKYLIPRIEVLKYPTKNGACVLSNRQYESLYKTVKEAHEKISENIGIKNGVTHTEFFIKNGIVYFSEIATRFAGAFAPEAIAHATGVDIIDEWIRAEIGEASLIPNEIKEYKNYGWLNFSPLTNGIIDKIPTEEELLKTPWIKQVNIRLKSGDNYFLNNPSIWSIFLIIEGESFEDFESKVEELYKLYRITTREED